VKGGDAIEKKAVISLLAISFAEQLV